MMNSSANFQPQTACPARFLPLVGLFFALFFPFSSTRAQVLFDATKAEMAGNADWVIDADAHDLRVSSAGDGSGTRGSGSAYTQSNPQRVPMPALGGIMSTTKENYWQGALSAWAVALAKRGQTVIETLPVFTTPTGTTRSRITYKDSTNAQDLSNYRMYVVCEPNIAFTAAEKTAILNYVKNGGSLFIIADHDGSDRNNDGIDAAGVWNDLFTSNTVQTNPFGFSFNLDNVSPAGGYANPSSSDPLTHGAAGTVTKLVYADGATMKINDVTVAQAAFWLTSSRASSQVTALYGRFGNGKFAAVGDSSPFDDGTGDTGDTLYDGWDDGNGDNAKLITNASLYLLNGTAPAATTNPATEVTWGTAYLNGTVNPNDYATSVYFEYGPDTSYGRTTPAQSLYGGTSSARLSARVTDLAASQVFHFRVVASNFLGKTYGADVALQTPLPPATGSTMPVSGVTSSDAVLNASVNPKGVATTCHLDFGTTTAYGFSSPEISLGSGTALVEIQLPLHGLIPNTLYHYRVTVTNASGTGSGGDQTFRTAAFVDADGDGLPDDYESARGFNPNNAADALGDRDGDGQSNLAEYLAGTDPADPADAFRTLAVSGNGADLTIGFATVFGKRYVVERTGSLITPAWSAVSAVLNGNGAPVTFTDAGAQTVAGAGAAFYRVRIGP